MPNLKVNIIDSPHSAGRGVGYYTSHLLQAFKKIPEVEITSQKPSLIHYPFFDLFYATLPIKKTLPTIVTIHDVTPLVLSSRYPKGFHGTLNLLHQWYSLRSVSAIITDSEASKSDIEKYLHISPTKIFVTPLAVDKIYREKPTAKQLVMVKAKFNLPDQFVLTVAGGPNPNKNLPMLAETTDRLGLPLVIVGQGLLQEIKGPVHPELIDLVRLQVYNHLILPGFVSNEDLNALYHLATFYVQPSLYEGFGLPLLEAMTAGCLTVSSRSSSLPEIYPPETINFNPQKVRSMEKAIQKALDLKSKDRATSISASKIRSQDFSWAKTAGLTLDVYQQVAKL